MPIRKKPLPDGRPVSKGFDCYECTICGARSYNSVKMNHKMDCPENTGRGMTLRATERQSE